MTPQEPKQIRVRPTTQDQADTLFLCFQMLSRGDSVEEISAVCGLREPLIAALAERFVT